MIFITIISRDVYTSKVVFQVVRFRLWI